MFKTLDRDPTRLIWREGYEGKLKVESWALVNSGLHQRRQGLIENNFVLFEEVAVPCWNYLRGKDEQTLSCIKSVSGGIITGR